MGGKVRGVCLVMLFAWSAHVTTALDLGVLEQLKHLDEGAPEETAPTDPASVAFANGLASKAEGDFLGAADHFYEAMVLRYNPLDKVYMHYLECYKRIGKLASGYYRIAEAFMKQRDTENALQLLMQVTSPDLYTEESREDIAAGFHLLGVIYSDSDMKKTLEAVGKAITLHPEKAEYHYELGTYLFAIQEWALSLESFRKCYELNPDLGAVLANMVYLETRVCEWDNFDEHMKLLEQRASEVLDEFEAAVAAVEKQQVASVIQAFSLKLSVEPHMTLSFPLDPVLKLRIAKRQALLEQVVALDKLGLSEAYVHRPSNHVAARRIRIGYVSADFRLKATSYLLRHMFQFHNRDVFEVYCFATTADSDEAAKARIGGSDWREDISSTVEHFMDISMLSPKDRVMIIKDKLKIDILINMDGYSNNGIRDVSVFQVQAAPVQMSMIVYVGSLGASYVQYVVTDKITSPLEYEDIYAEKFIHMPQSFFANVHAITKELSPPTREKPEKDAFTFCNFNKHLKISPSVFSLWLDILLELVNRKLKTKLLFLEFPKDSLPNLRAYIRTNFPELDKSDLFTFKAIPFVSSPYVHQRRIGSLCDVVLDNPIYNAHTMAVDTLWSGVPLLTFGNGVDMGGRVGNSILHELGLEELVANSSDEYKDTAVELATNKTLYTDIRSRLVESCYDPVNRFWNPRLYVHHLEKGYLSAWIRFLEGKNPDHICIDGILPDEEPEFTLPLESCTAET